MLLHFHWSLIRYAPCVWAKPPSRNIMLPSPHTHPLQSLPLPSLPEISIIFIFPTRISFACSLISCEWNMKYILSRGGCFHSQILWCSLLVACIIICCLLLLNGILLYKYRSLFIHTPNSSFGLWWIKILWTCVQLLPVCLWRYVYVSLR